MQAIKGLMKSKTFWANALMAVATVANEFQGQVIPSKYAAEIIVVVNVLLRFVTTKPLSEK
jgi:formaldehyde-activating enzyme involved in methanogenesis